MTRHGSVCSQSAESAESRSRWSVVERGTFERRMTTGPWW